MVALKGEKLDGNLKQYTFFAGEGPFSGYIVTLQGINVWVWYELILHIILLRLSSNNWKFRLFISVPLVM